MSTQTRGAGEDILIIEDDVELAELLQSYFADAGLSTVVCSHGDRAVGQIRARLPRLVILDVMLPGLDGLEVCRRVRDTYDGAILMLTALKTTTTEVEALELGADDFVGKPVAPRALLARVHSLLRRVDGTVADEVRRIGPLHVDRRARTVHVRGQRVRLTATELDVLWLLCKRPGEVVTRYQLYKLILGIGYDGLDRSMDVHVSRIRSKLDEHALAPVAIKSVRGEGYVLVQ